MDRRYIYIQVAALHAASIDRGFLATLGVRFLSLLYRAIDEAEGSALIFEERDGWVLGFVSGGEGMRPIYRRMLRHPLQLGWSLLPVLFRPRALLRILDIVRYGREPSTEQSFPKAELLSIAVAQGVRGTGIAELLYKRLEQYFREHGADAFRIVVGSTLSPAHRFYTKMGAIHVGEIEVHAGEHSLVYVQSLLSNVDTCLDVSEDVDDC